MRSTLFVTGCALLSASAGCKWTDFDDLEKDTWVSSTDKPNGDSTDYGVAIARGQRSTNGGKLVVIGAGQAQYTELVYSPNGDSDLAPTALKLNTQFGIGNLDPQPILIPDPTTTSDEVSLVVNSGSQSIAVLTGTGGLLAHQVFGPEQPDAATYMVPPPRVDQPSLPTPAQVLVGSGDALYGAFAMNVPNPQTKCQLQDPAASPVSVRGLGAARVTSTTFDDVVVWGSIGGNAGKLMIFPGGVFNGNPPVGPCTGGTAQPIAVSVTDTPFVPSKGSQIVMVDSTHFLAVGHKDIGTADSFLGFYSIGPTGVITATGAPVTLSDLRTAAVLTVGTKKYVVAGYPTAIVENVKAGRVLVFPLDMTAGIDATPAAQLYDSQPEDNQQFGRAVAAMPFNGAEVVAVAADNEIFVYFELGPAASNPPMGSIYGDKRVR